MWQEERQLLLEQQRVQQAESEGHGAGGNGDPQWAKRGAAVALLDVLPAQLQPQLALAEADS